MADVNVAILGLERLGTSFGLALKRYMQDKEASHRFTIVGSDGRGYNTKEAKRLGAVDSTEHNASRAVKDAHIVLIAAAYEKVEDLYYQIGPSLKPGAVVLDASPLKRPSIKWAKEALPQDAEVAVYMVGVMPVLNPEVLFEANTDIETARADLFDKGTLILAPSPDCPAEAVELAAEVGRIIGASVHFMDPDEHDGLIAATEGLPAVTGLAMFQAFVRSEGWDDLRRLANPSFGLATQQLRFSNHNALWGLLQYNRENTARHLTALIEILEEVRDSLEQDEDGLGLEALLEQSASQYEEWEGNRLANRWGREESDKPIVAGGFMSSMGGMLFGRRTPKDGDKK